MTPLIIGYIGIALLLVLLFSGIHIGLAMGVIGFLGMVCVNNWTAGLMVLKTVPFTTFSNYGLPVVPLFILLGIVCFHAGISKDLYEGVHKWLGHLKGGLAMATVGACAIFAAVSGSSLATAATMGTVALPEMKRYKYDPALATGAIAAGGSIGILIPPSVPLVIYGILANQSIGKLFMAGIIPGILEALFYIITIAILCSFKPNIGPPGPKTRLADKMGAVKATWGVLILFIVVIGGIYLGVFSPTEAAGVGACGACIFALIRKRLPWPNLKNSLVGAVKTTSMIFIILLGAMILGYFLAATRLPFELAEIIGGLPVNRYVILVLILVIFILLGCVMDSLAIIILTIPIFFPLIDKLGFDPVWFGILVVRAAEIGLITPPVGMNVFIIKGIAKDVPMYTIFRGIFPFIIADLCHVALLLAVPQLSLFIPGLMK
ncbi:MAG: TRAP transporter large permease subunit [Deltaproteobacteria bacterium]|nr:TRAP transporter large permease subunit [Deltaproteobacteria bacterium]